MTKVVLATDGSFRPKKKVGGWAAGCLMGDRIWAVSGHVPHAKDAREMELLAIRESLVALAKPCQVTVLTDDQAITRLLEKGEMPEQKTKLWFQLLHAALPHSVEVQWIKGHAGHALNEQAHALAKLAGQLPLEEKKKDKKAKKAKAKKAKPAPQTVPE